MRLFRRRFVYGVAALALLCATGSLVVAQSKKEKPAAAQKPMSVEEARKVAATTKRNFATPPRTIDDIAKVLDQNKPDPVKIANLKKTADTPLPANSSGMTKADFLMARGLAARDLGRTQQRVKDLCEAYETAKPWVFRKSPIYVVDFPTPGNPDGSAAFQAYINAKRAAKREAAQASGGPRPGGRRRWWRWTRQLQPRSQSRLRLWRPRRWRSRVVEVAVAAVAAISISCRNRRRRRRPVSMTGSPTSSSAPSASGRPASAPKPMPAISRKPRPCSRKAGLTSSR